METFYTVAEVAEIFRRSKNTVWHWIRTGKLDAKIDPAGRYIISSKELGKYVDLCNNNKDAV